MDPPPGQLGSGYTGVADATVAPGQTARESHTESAFATACPDASGYDPAGAEYTTTTSLSIVGDHRLRMLSDITASTRARAIGHVNETGKLKNFDVVIDVELKGDARVVGPAGLIHGNPMSTLQKMRIVYTGLDPHSYQDEEFTSAHIGQISLSGLQDGRYEFGADGSLLGSQDVGKLLAFARIPLLKLREALERAEHNFFDDARCLRAEFSPATLTVEAGSSTAASARVLSTLDGAPVSIDLQLKALASGTVSPPLVHAAPSSPARFVFTAGSKEDDDAITLAGTSRQGRVFGYLKDHTVATPTFPYYFRVLGSTYSTHADGQTMPGSYNVCESQQLRAGGSEDWKGSSGALTFSSANALSRADSTTGALSGRVWADVPTILDSAVFGCAFDSHGAVTPCQQTFPSQTPKPNGTTTIGFSITAPSADTPSATLHWAVPDPQVGIAGGGSDPCNAPYLTQPIPFLQLNQGVAVTQLSSTQPQTYTFSGGPLHWSTDSIGQPASLNYQWQYTITIQRVNQDGTPVS